MILPRPVTIVEFVANRRGEALEALPDPNTAKRRRQLFRTAQSLALELSEDRAELAVSIGNGAASAQSVCAEFSILSGTARIAVDRKIVEALTASWSASLQPVASQVPMLERYSFLLAQRCARHAFRSRYGVKLQSVSEQGIATGDRVIVFDLLLKTGDTPPLSGACAVEIDEALTLRTDWYAVRNPIYSERRRRLEQLLEEQRVKR